MEKSPSDKRRDKFRQHVEAQKASGLTQKEFCKRNDLVLSHFVYYRCLLKKQANPAGKTSAFRPVKITEEEKSLARDIQVSLPNGFSCQIPADADSDKVRQLIQVLLVC